MSLLTKCLSYSFSDRDTFMRHFGYGVGHLKCERQHENEPDHDMAVDDISDSSDIVDDTAGDSDPDELEINHNHGDKLQVAIDSEEEEEEEEEEEYDGEIVGDEGGDWDSDASDAINVASDSVVDESSTCASDGYASY